VVFAEAKRHGTLAIDLRYAIEFMNGARCPIFALDVPSGLDADTGAVLGLPLCGVIAHFAGYRTMFATMALAAVAGLALVRFDARAERLRLS